MPYQFYTADVFTDRRFGGNQLAVFPEAEGLSREEMQLIAREFNYSETVFVFPPETDQGTKRLRIFTPEAELPFAGHPTVGTAYVLASIGVIELKNEITTIILEEGIGAVEVKIKSQQGKPVYTELNVTKMPDFDSKTPSLTELASILSIKVEDIVTKKFNPQAVSCGVPFLFIPVGNRQILGQIRLNQEKWTKILANYWASSLYVFCQNPEENSQIRARMFAPALGINEDPATGSAATALGGYLAVRESLENGTFSWQIEQGFEMNRPSLIQVEVDKKQGEIRAIRVGGASVLVSQGVFG